MPIDMTGNKVPIPRGSVCQMAYRSKNGYVDYFMPCVPLRVPYAKEKAVFKEKTAFLVAGPALRGPATFLLFLMMRSFDQAAVDRRFLEEVYRLHAAKALATFTELAKVLQTHRGIICELEAGRYHCNLKLLYLLRPTKST
jgi:hypothetical protein